MKNSDDPLNTLIQIVARGGGASDEDVERLASSPFFNAQVRARIEAERQRRDVERSSWPITLLVASRAIAVLLIVTLAAAAAYWATGKGALAPSRSNKADDVSRVMTGGTCALSATDECAISNEEVLATLFAEEGGNTQK